jgi:hypothetical protein
MNCLDFHRDLLSDPFSADPELLAHEEGCPSCAGFAREVRAQEVKLRSLLQDVSPPRGLAERIQLAAGFERRAEARRRWWYSAAAGVLLAIGISMISLWNTTLERGDTTLAQSVLHHIDDEAHHLREAGPVAAGRLNWVFERFGAELTGDIGPVNFAAECLMRKRNGVHLVLPGKMGAITVFFMPGEMTDEVMEVTSERFDGRILPTAWGSIAVVGETGEALEGLGERLVTAVRWPAPQALSDSAALGRTVAVDGRVGQEQDG